MIKGRVFAEDTFLLPTVSGPICAKRIKLGRSSNSDRSELFKDSQALDDSGCKGIGTSPSAGQLHSFKEGIGSPQRTAFGPAPGGLLNPQSRYGS